MMAALKKIIYLLSRRERRWGYLLLFIILIMSFLDFAGVATIIPFLAVLGNPEMVETNRWLSLVYKGLNFTDPATFLFFLGMVFFVFLVFSTAFKVLTEWAMYRFSFMRTHSLSCRLLQGYLGRPMPGF